VALSDDGLHFSCRDEILGKPYFRVFEWRGTTYALGMPGTFYRSGDGLTDFEEGPHFWTRDMRHAAVMVEDDVLTVFFSNAYECPEHILMSTVKLTPDWTAWEPTAPVSVMKPETDYEGVNLPLVDSERGWAPECVRQLRDPAVYREDGRLYLLYSVAGENGIAIAELER
jgi:hypothetical protein